ncbi:MAG: putative OB-fold protein, partial [Glaciecola sp.]
MAGVFVSNENSSGGALVADHVLQFAYTRSTGPVIGAFLTGLRDAKVFGIRAQDGRIMVPPQEYDPVTSQDLTVDDLVQVSSEGAVTTWSWNPEPRPGQPIQGRGSAWALVLLDGADTPILLALDATGPEHVKTGMRVKVRWAQERIGHIGDIVCVTPITEEAEAIVASSAGDLEPVTVVTSPVEVALTHKPGPAELIFLRGTQERKLLGRACSKCTKVYLPPRGVCSMCGAAFTDEIVEVGQTGTVATFAIVNVPFAGQEVEIPYAA